MDLHSGGKMICPNCGTQNVDTSRFCLKCGTKLPAPEEKIILSSQPPITKPRTAPDLLAQSALIGGLVSMAGGVLSILGWLLPWFALGGLMNLLLKFIGIGSSSSLLNFASGFGNGIQISLFSLIAGVAAIGSEDAVGIVIGILCIVIGLVIISIPILAALIFRTGLKSFEARLSDNQQNAAGKYDALQNGMQKVRGRSISIFVIMLVIFVLVATFPIGIALLSGGFYLTVFGALISLLGSYFARLKLRTYKVQA